MEEELKLRSAKEIIPEIQLLVDIWAKKDNPQSDVDIETVLTPGHLVVHTIEEEIIKENKSIEEAEEKDREILEIDLDQEIKKEKEVTITVAANAATITIVKNREEGRNNDSNSTPLNQP